MIKFLGAVGNNSQRCFEQAIDQCGKYLSKDGIEDVDFFYTENICGSANVMNDYRGSMNDLIESMKEASDRKHKILFLSNTTPYRYKTNAKSNHLLKIGMDGRFLTSDSRDLPKSLCNIFDNENNCVASMDLYGDIILICMRSAISSYCKPNGFTAYMRMIFNQIMEHGLVSSLFDKTIFAEEDEIRKKKEAEKQTYAFNSIDESISKKIKKDEIIEEMLNKVDYKTLCSIINCSIRRNNPRLNFGFINAESIRTWLQEWANKKWKLYVLFGNKLKISDELSIDKDDTEINNDIYDLCYKFPKYAFTLQNIHPGMVKKNELTDNIFPHPFYSDKMGKKLSKALSDFLQDEKFDVEFSKIIQEKKTCAVLSISIDPYDYLTMAVNKHRWRSCQNFIDGERNLGSAAYLFDDNTTVAYMCGKKDYDYEEQGYKWTGNSKRWRQLINIGTEENILMFCREYPQKSTNPIVSQTIRQFLEKNIADFCKIEDRWKIKYRGCINGKTHISAENSVHYEDFINTADSFSNSNYFVRHIGKKPEKMITLGYAVKCPVCNKNLANLGRIICDDCYRSMDQQSVKKEKKFKMAMPDPYGYEIFANEPVLTTADTAVARADVELENGNTIRTVHTAEGGERPRRAFAPQYVTAFEVEAVRGGIGYVAAQAGVNGEDLTERTVRLINEIGRVQPIAHPDTQDLLVDVGWDDENDEENNEGDPGEF